MRKKVSLVTNTLKVGVAGTLTYLVGGFDLLLQTVVLFMVLDYLTGVTAGWYECKLNSERGLRGIIKKVCMLVLIVVGHKIDQLSGQDGTIRTMVLYFLLANEGISILENLGRVGITIPSWIKKSLEKLSDKGVM
jgi:toxin secretion/phage lysis holin